MPKTASRASQILTTTSIVSFSLTLLAGGTAVLTGLVPLGHLTFGERVDVGTLLFVMPMVALVLAVVFEVTRIALTAPKLPEPRRQQRVRWTPGRREG
jgi:hypothetical protein